MKMKKKILIVFAHPEQTSLTRTMVNTSIEVLEKMGHEVITSDLYAMKWKAVYDEEDFPVRANSERLSFIHESGNAYATQNLTPDVVKEQEKLLKSTKKETGNKNTHLKYNKENMVLAQLQSYQFNNRFIAVISIINII